MNINRFQLFSVIFAFVMITWGILPFADIGSLTSFSIASSIILILIGIAYPLIIFKPQWNKVVLLVEGAVFTITGIFLLIYPSNILFLILGLALIALSLLAYAKKLPQKYLKFFYRTPK